MLNRCARNQVVWVCQVNQESTLGSAPESHRRGVCWSGPCRWGLMSWGQKLSGTTSIRARTSPYCTSESTAVAVSTHVPQARSNGHRERERSISQSVNGSHRDRRMPHHNRVFLTAICVRPLYVCAQEAAIPPRRMGGAQVRAAVAGTQPRHLHRPHLPHYRPGHLLLLLPNPRP